MKNSKYILFEVIVVFIGVSSAFFLNNYRNDRNTEAKEINYTERLIKDMSYNIEDLKAKIDMDTNNINHSKSLLKALHSNNLPEDSITRILELISTFGTINLQYTTYEEILNNGEFNILSNDSIRELIIETKNLYENVLIREKTYTDFYYLMLPYIIDNFDLMNFKATNKSLLTDSQFRNYFLINTGLKGQTVVAYEKLYTLSVELHQLLIRSEKQLKQ